MSKHCRLEPADRQLVPSFQFLPATFTNGINSFKIRRHTLYDDDAARDQRRRVHPNKSFVSLDSETSVYWEELLNRDEALCKQDPSRPEMIILDDPAPELLHMHMCVIFAPWADRSSSKSEQGIFVLPAHTLGMG
jgi:hypothetical protein